MKRSKITLGKGKNIKDFSIYNKKEFHEKLNTNKLIFSPVHGIIDYIKKSKNKTEIGIYIRGYNDVYYDPHSFYSPISNSIDDIIYKPGEFTRKFKHKILLNSSIKSSRSEIKSEHYYKKIKFPKDSTIYKSSEKKNGKLIIKMKNIEFTIEVGHKYITKSLVLYSKNNEYVLTGQHIGDILIGSYCIIKINNPCKLHIDIGYNVKGGISPNPIASF